MFINAIDLRNLNVLMAPGCTAYVNGGKSAITQTFLGSSKTNRSWA